ncbi:MAG: VIT1/CCC1 family protein [bacterium]|nr:VIT1/CCC1 family protein [bacterium]
MNKDILEAVKIMQLNEATEHVIYAHMARRASGANARVLAKIAAEEGRHAEIWSKYTGRMPKPSALKVLFYRLCGMLFGLTFVINLMETGEEKAQVEYARIAEYVPEALKIYEQEEEHEHELIAMVDDERLKYISSMVLGINDALVELTGALAGFTFALGNTTVICMAGFITGSAATLSMAASEYLAKKNDPGEGRPLKAAVYTGIAYMFAVCMLLVPYAFICSPLLALAGCLVNAALVIMLFTFYVSVVRKEPFAPAFREMICISFGVAALSFLIGWGAQKLLGISM